MPPAPCAMPTEDSTAAAPESGPVPSSTPCSVALPRVLSVADSSSLPGGRASRRSAAPISTPARPSVRSRVAQRSPAAAAKRLTAARYRAPSPIACAISPSTTWTPLAVWYGETRPILPAVRPMARLRNASRRDCAREGPRDPEIGGRERERILTDQGETVQSVRHASHAIGDGRDRCADADLLERPALCHVLHETRDQPLRRRARHRPRRPGCRRARQCPGKREHRRYRSSGRSPQCTLEHRLERGYGVMPRAAKGSAALPAACSSMVERSVEKILVVLPRHQQINQRPTVNCSLALVSTADVPVATALASSGSTIGGTKPRGGSQLPRRGGTKRARPKSSSVTRPGGQSGDYRHAARPRGGRRMPWRPGGQTAAGPRVLPARAAAEPPRLDAGAPPHHQVWRPRRSPRPRNRGAPTPPRCWSTAALQRTCAAASAQGARELHCHNLATARAGLIHRCQPAAERIG